MSSTLKLGSLLVLVVLSLLSTTSFAFTRGPVPTLLHQWSGPRAASAQAPVVARSTTSVQPSLWGLIGNDGTHLSEERAAGIQAKVFALSWRAYVPSPGTISSAFVQRKRAELASLRAAGFSIILSLGVHDTPAWVHDQFPDSYYVNQFGERYDPGGIDAGEANLVFNPALRAVAAAYIQQVFTDFGTDFAAVRLGGGRYGELTYPPAKYGLHTNVYWAFDRNALAHSPTPLWLPGQPSPAGEAGRFLDWYLGALVDFQTWQIRTVRQSYAGPLMMLYPSWGIRPTDIDRAVAVNLNGSTSAERNGEIQRGFDFARQIAALNDPQVIVTTTWLDADASADTGSDPRYWSPIKYLASLAAAHPLQLRLYGENTGQGDVAAMDLSAAQVRRFGLLGMAWFREDQLFSGTYATLNDYRQVIAGNG